MSTLKSAPKKTQSRSENYTETTNTPSRHRLWSVRELKAVYAQRLILSGEVVLSVRHDPRGILSHKKLPFEEEFYSSSIHPRYSHVLLAARDHC